MIAVLQRVTQARVEVAGDVVGAIHHGLLALVCAEPSTPTQRFRNTKKCLRAHGGHSGTNHPRDTAGIAVVCALPWARIHRFRHIPKFLCRRTSDTPATADKLLAKILKLRVFEDSAGKMNLSLQAVAGGLLLVSQFSLAADTRSGNRPGFAGAALPAVAQPLFEHLVVSAQVLHPVVASSRFAANMQVHLINDGPVTIPLRVL